MWSSLYYFIAKNTLRYFDRAGERVLRRALRAFGTERGETMRRQHQPTPPAHPARALVDAYDLPRHPECMCTINEEDHILTISISHSPMIATWDALGGGCCADLYLEEVPTSLARAFDRRLLPAVFRRGNSLVLRLAHDASIPAEEAPVAWQPRSYDDRTGPVAQLSNHFGLLYYHLARGLVDAFGPSGRRVLIEGIQAFGKNRGFRMRADHLELGMPIDLVTMTNNRDMPRDDRTTGTRDVLQPDRRLSRVFRCQYHEIWAEHDASDVGRIYCDYVHHAIWQAYHPGIELDLAKTLTRADDICLFDVTCDLGVLDPVNNGESGGGRDDGS